MIRSIGHSVLKNVTIPLVRKLWIESIYGLDRIPKDSAAIIIANHASYLDFLILGSIVEGIVKRPLYFWANSKVCNHPIFKHYTKCFNSIELDYERKTSTFWKKSIEKIKQNQLIGIFPEGTRTRTGCLLDFNTGYLRLAITTSCPIVPVVISNTYSILPPHQTIPNLRKCNVYIHEPIFITPGASKLDYPEINERIHFECYKTQLGSMV